LPGAIVPIWSCPRKVNRTVQGRNLDRFDRRKSSLNQQFNFALIPETGNDASVAGGIGPGYEEPARLDEGMLQLHVALQQKSPIGLLRRSDRGRFAVVQIGLACFWRNGVEDLLA